MTPRTQRICVAQIGAPHGVRGEVKLWPFTADPLSVRDYGPLETEDGAARFEIETLRAAKDHLVVAAQGRERPRRRRAAHQHQAVRRA